MVEKELREPAKGFDFIGARSCLKGAGANHISVLAPRSRAILQLIARKSIALTGYEAFKGMVEVKDYSPIGCWTVKCAWSPTPSIDSPPQPALV